MSTGHATSVTDPADIPVEERERRGIAEPTPVTRAVRTHEPFTTTLHVEGTA